LFCHFRINKSNKIEHFAIFLKLIQAVPKLPPQKKKGSTYLGKRDNLNFKEKSPISSDNREKTRQGKDNFVAISILIFAV
jgi:hypothetical protein